MTDQAELFAERRETHQGHIALAASAGAHAEEVRKLVPVAEELVDRLGSITVVELRETAAARGLIPEHGKARELSWLGAVFRAAGLETTGERRRHRVPGTHGKWVAVWRRPAPATP